MKLVAAKTAAVKMLHTSVSLPGWKVFVEQVSGRPDSQNIQINKIDDAYQQRI